ncbi:hypothetical protein Q7P37_010939 [Cladosporium fusiforme]
MDDTYDEREEELSSLIAIYPELTCHDDYSASINLPVTPSTRDREGLFVTFRKEASSLDGPDRADPSFDPPDGEQHHLRYLPDLKLHIALPEGYPENNPPTVALETDHEWVPALILRKLEQSVAQLWDEYGKCQILFVYIDSLIQSASDGFGLNDDGKPWELPFSYESALTSFNHAKSRSVFEAGTYDCGICLERKKGTDCYSNFDCNHIFCKPCLQDFYNNAITEGDVDSIKCLDPDCGKEKDGRPARKKQSSLHPCMLMEMGISEATARRYVGIKRKKRMDVDPNTVYCPLKKCKHPARNDKYPPIPENLEHYHLEDEEDAPKLPADPLLPNKPSPDSNVDERLAVCENPSCRMAFCRICYKSWHGSYERCRPRDADELSPEEKASYDYIAQNTTPCAYCKAPVQKTYGCNHMHCYQCGTHFCYLCSAWLNGDNPYQHFNKEGESCYQKLFDLDENDEQLAMEAAMDAEEAELEERMVAMGL